MVPVTSIVGEITKITPPPAPEGETKQKTEQTKKKSRKKKKIETTKKRYFSVFLRGSRSIRPFLPP
jgi:hypothetical protein